MLNKEPENRFFYEKTKHFCLLHSHVLLYLSHNITRVNTKGSGYNVKECGECSEGTFVFTKYLEDKSPSVKSE